jgi:ribulose-bisphosphate carboxylase small chain
MAALSAVAPVLNKAPAVSTGKAANTNSMMVWQPHGNKCVPSRLPCR